MVRIDYNITNDILLAQGGKPKTPIKKDLQPNIGDALIKYNKPETTSSKSTKDNHVTDNDKKQKNNNTTKMDNPQQLEGSKNNKEQIHNKLKSEPSSKGNSPPKNFSSNTSIKKSNLTASVIGVTSNNVKDSSPISDSDKINTFYEHSSKYLRDSQTIGYNSKEIYQTPQFLKATVSKAKKLTNNVRDEISAKMLSSSKNKGEISPEFLKSKTNNLISNAKSLNGKFEAHLDNINKGISNNRRVKWINKNGKNLMNKVQKANPLVETRVINTANNGEVILNTAKSKTIRTMSMAIRSEGAQVVGKALGRAAIAYGIYEGTKETYNAFKNKGKTAGVVEGAKQTGGLVGAYVGSKIGVAIGAPILPPVGAIVGGLVGGAVGYIAGSGVGKQIGKGVAKVAKSTINATKKVGAAAVGVAKKVVKTQAETTKKILITTIKTGANIVKNITPKSIKDGTKKVINSLPSAMKTSINKAASWLGF